MSSAQATSIGGDMDEEFLVSETKPFTNSGYDGQALRYNFHGHAARSRKHPWAYEGIRSVSRRAEQCYSSGQTILPVKTAAAACSSRRRHRDHITADFAANRWTVSETLASTAYVHRSDTIQTMQDRRREQYRPVSWSDACPG